MNFDKENQKGVEQQAPAPEIPDEAVEQASEDSFPASDAPGWTRVSVGPPATKAVERPKKKKAA